MSTWGDVFKTIIGCGAALFLVMATIWAIDANTAIRSLQEDVEALKGAQRPLIAIDGKYLSVFTRKNEVVIQTGKEGYRE